jgi:hypothetical protein
LRFGRLALVRDGVPDSSTSMTGLAIQASGGASLKSKAMVAAVS